MYYNWRDIIMEKTIPAEVVDKYINGYFKHKYHIDIGRQPHFWDAVRVLSANINADVSRIIDENADYCLIDVFGYYSVKYVESDVTTVTDLAKKIATEIIEEENKTILPVDVFLLSKKLEEIEKDVNYLRARNAIYG